MKALIARAKEKGFDEDPINHGFPVTYVGEIESYLWMCLLQKWLRDEHRVYFNITPNTFRGVVVSYNAEVATPDMVWDEPLKAEYKDYEQALEEALTKALGLI